MEIDTSVQLVGPRKVLYGQATVGICCIAVLQDVGAMEAVSVRFIGRWCVRMWPKWESQNGPY